MPEILKIKATGEKEIPHGVSVKKIKGPKQPANDLLANLLPMPKKKTSLNLDDHVNIKIMTSGGEIAGEAHVKTPEKMKAIRDKRGVN